MVFQFVGLMELISVPMFSIRWEGRGLVQLYVGDSHLSQNPGVAGNLNCTFEPLVRVEAAPIIS